MEDSYGKKYQSLRLSGMIHLPFVMLTILFCVAFIALLKSALGGNSVLIGPAIACGVLFVLFLTFLLRQIISMRLDVYESTLVQQNLFNKRIIRAEDVRAVIWQFPGVNPMNSRAARVNNTSAEIIFKDGTKTVKIQDSYYQNLEKEVSAFQRHNDIPADLETKKKGGHRYD